MHTAQSHKSLLLTKNSTPELNDMTQITMCHSSQYQLPDPNQSNSNAHML